MTDDFIRLRTPRASESEQVQSVIDVYEVALELARLVGEVIEATAARYHLRDRLDRAATSIALHVARATREVSIERRKGYREALATVTDIGTLLDVLDRQQVTNRPGALSAARYVARRLQAELEPLAGVRTATV